MFQNSKISAEIFGIPEELLKVQWELLKAINSSKMVDMKEYKRNANKLFHLWVNTFRKPMTANVHLLIAHGADYIRLAKSLHHLPYVLHLMHLCQLCILWLLCISCIILS